MRQAAGEASGEAELDLVDEPRFLALAVRHREPGHEVDALGELRVAPLGDEQRVVARLRDVAPVVAHLRRALEVELVGVELEAPRVVQGRAGLHAQQGRVRHGVARLDVVQVIGRHERQIEGTGQPQQVGAHLALDPEAVIHEFAEVVAGPEDVAQLGGRRDRTLVLPEP